ncbi:MAG: hypothetical protein HC868_09815 [Sphingomonadales bacterium]|nr:hypothetical protein [Sphingomonadales bacterium]
MRQYVSQISAAAALVGLLALGGCGGIEGVELNGKVFDWLGISAASQQKAEPKMADRAPLVVPPSVTRLPDPGSGRSSSEDVAALNDPELRKQAAAKERQRLHEAYCRGEIQWKNKAFKPDDVGANRSPYGTCGILGSVTTNITK